jgi:GGDEF domain-containing protein
MSLNSRPTLNSLIRHLLTRPLSSTDDVMDDLMVSLDSALPNDACAILRFHPGSGTALIIAEKDLHYPPENSTGGIEVPGITALLSGCSSGQIITARGPFNDDPLLGGEKAEVLLLACVDFGTERLVTLALRRRAEKFTDSEEERFLIISGFISLIIGSSHEVHRHGQHGEVDPLTGLGLYPAFHDTLEREISRSRRRSGKITVSILALAGKGELGGAEQVPSSSALLLAADTLVEQLRSFDTIIRYSPSEFALILPDIGGRDAEKVIKRVVAAVRSSNGKKALPLYAGMSCYPEDGSTAERLIETAEAALNLAVREDSAVTRWREG